MWPIFSMRLGVNILENCKRFNVICKTNFTVSDMILIYSKLGNGINRELTYEFIKSGFNLKVLFGGE